MALLRTDLPFASLVLDLANHLRITSAGLGLQAGEGNRTLVFSLEGYCSTIELHPRRRAGRAFRAFLIAPVLFLSLPPTARIARSICGRPKHLARRGLLTRQVHATDTPTIDRHTPSRGATLRDGIETRRFQGGQWGVQDSNL